MVSTMDVLGREGTDSLCSLIQESVVVYTLHCWSYEVEEDEVSSW